ncbi:hypothetical protein BGZ65_008509, partial [Modicella reniformis]
MDVVAQEATATSSLGGVEPIETEAPAAAAVPVLLTETDTGVLAAAPHSSQISEKTTSDSTRSVFDTNTTITSTATASVIAATTTASMSAADTIATTEA